MSQVYTFHETVRGHHHVMNEIPCEDSSASFSAESGRYHIAVVADGHGAKSCFRSDYGAKAATDVALECLQQFAEAILVSEKIEDKFYKDLFSNPHYRQMTIRRLTDTIIAGWHDRVLDNYENNPPSRKKMGEDIEECEEDRDVVRVYGCTLIAALQLPKCLLLLHQGDGRCDVFYVDGSVNQPIPWDSRCEDTVTTSLCDEDVAESFRSCIINLVEKPVMACYLGCDGVEDAYRDTYEELGGSHVLMGGVHTFYKDITCQLAAMERDEFEKYLKIMLSKFSAEGRFSRSGSGDDVSVAGIVDVDIIQRFVGKFEYDVKRYALEEERFWKEDELRSKTRKHAILQKRMIESETFLQDVQKEQQFLEMRLQQMKVERNEFSKKAERTKAELEVYRQESQSVVEHLEAKCSKFSSAVQHFLDEISIGCSIKETAYSKIMKKLSDYDEKIKGIEEMQSVGIEKMRELEDKFVKEKLAFEEYDAKYQATTNDRIHIENEITALMKKKQE